MIKMLFYFVFLFVAFWFGIDGVRTMAGKERWKLTKLAAYSLVCAILTVGVLIGIVLLF